MPLVSPLPPRSLGDTDRGAAAILVAAAMFLVMGFAAIAIDAAGVGFNERRQDQSASDVAALAAVQFAVPEDLGNVDCTGLSGLTLSRCNGAVEAIEVANATLDDPSLANWNDPTKCSTPPAGFTVSPVTDCVAFSANNQQAWVRIPLIDHDTTFGGVIGYESVTTSADAIAITQTAPPGGVLPFLVPGNAAGQDHNCLKTGPNPTFGDCDDLPSVGNFGSMDFFLYGNDYYDWDVKCAGDENGRLKANIARGVDHPLGLYPNTGDPPTYGVPGKEEASHCPNWGAKPDMANGQPGVGSALEDGLLYGGTAYASSEYPGAIEDPGGYLVRNGGGSKAEARVDDRPLWDYLLSGLGGSCSDFPDPVNTPAEMLDCIEWAKNNGTVIFNGDCSAGPCLVEAMRYGWTPEIWEDDFSGGSSAPYHIKDFLPVYIDTIFFGCTATKCDIIYTSGVADSGPCPNNPPDAQITCGTPGAFNKPLQAVTAYILSQAIVPDNAKTPPPGSGNQLHYNLSE